MNADTAVFLFFFAHLFCWLVFVIKYSIKENFAQVFYILDMRKLQGLVTILCCSFSQAGFCSALIELQINFELFPHKQLIFKFKFF